MSNLRILRVIPVLDFGGVESLFLTQARYWDNASIQVEYLTFWKDGRVADRMRAFGAKVHVLDVDPSIRNPKATIALYKFLRIHRPDIVHSSIGEANFHTMLCAPWGDYKVLIHEDGIPNRTLRNRLIYAGLYRLVDGIVAVSNASKQYLEEQEWAPKKRTRLIYNAIDENFFQVQRSQPYNPKNIRFRAVGRLSEVKNFEFLIRVFHHVSKSIPSIYLDIVGDGPLRETLQQQIETPETRHIRLWGFGDDIPKLHETTDWLLIPSHSEGFGIVAVEAMAAGVPVIASNAGALPEVLGELAENWTLAPTDFDAWADKIIQAAHTDAKTYSELSESSKERGKSFHPQRYISELAKLYIDVFTTKGCIENASQ